MEKEWEKKRVQSVKLNRGPTNNKFVCHAKDYWFNVEDN